VSLAAGSIVDMVDLESVARRRHELSLAAFAYAAVTGPTLYAAGHVVRRASLRAQIVLGRLAGILLTAIAVTLVVSGGTRMVHAVLTTANSRHLGSRSHADSITICFDSTAATSWAWSDAVRSA
jgi:hypothetical protein